MSTAAGKFALFLSTFWRLWKKLRFPYVLCTQRRTTFTSPPRFFLDILPASLYNRFCTLRFAAFVLVPDPFLLLLFLESRLPPARARSGRKAAGDGSDGTDGGL